MAFSTFLYRNICNKVIMYPPYLRSRDLCFPSFRAQYLHNLFGILHSRFLYPLCINLPYNLFPSIWTHRYSFYNLDYNLILFVIVVIVVAQTVPVWPTDCSFTWLPGSFCASPSSPLLWISLFLSS